MKVVLEQKDLANINQDPQTVTIMDFRSCVIPIMMYADLIIFRFSTDNINSERCLKNKYGSLNMEEIK